SAVRRPGRLSLSGRAAVVRGARGTITTRQARLTIPQWLNVLSSRTLRRWLPARGLRRRIAYAPTARISRRSRCPLEGGAPGLHAPFGGARPRRGHARAHARGRALYRTAHRYWLLLRLPPAPPADAGR